eukprot:CAMPEP_0180321226 /NCGR_PEP_ID=MMETSP0988-20121125/36021_1 /TAXON_ID=697907 /ORGANISM="non described non described, Strain CCMP2293" /LENGTH=35 /DNA_ID= /DNA_START= /DNA_END= /DNA_ORIENTATION=
MSSAARQAGAASTAGGARAREGARIDQATVGLFEI